MEVKVKTNPSSNQTNPQQNQKTNLQNPQNNVDLQKIIEDVVSKYLTNVNNKTSNTLQSQQNDEEFIIKSAMKASYVALRVEQLLTLKKKAALSALGFAVPIMLDSIMLVKKDLSKQLGINVNIGGIELFEMEVNDKGKNKKITGMRVVLSI
jgi:TPP-dependent indolepyruvate ferredoxin oxidoreductase alpha subunit